MTAEIHDASTLVARFQQGDVAAFEEFLGRTKQLVAQTALRVVRDEHLVHDVLQDVFLKALQQVGQIRDASRFRSWIASIARRTAIDHVRRNTGRWVSLEALAHEPEGRLPATPESLLAAAELCRVLLEWLQDLSPFCRAVAYLKFVAGWSNREIQDHLRLTRQAVDKRIHRAREQLAERLRRHDRAAGTFSVVA